MVVTNLVRWYVLINGFIIYGRMPCFEDSVGTIKPHLVTHNADIWILVIGNIIGLVFFPILLLVFLCLKNRRAIIFTLTLLTLEILIRMTNGFEYLMDI